MINQEVNEELLKNRMSRHELADLLNMTYTNLNTKMRSELNESDKSKFLQAIRTGLPVERDLTRVEQFAKDWDEVRLKLKPRFGAWHELENG